MVLNVKTSKIQKTNKGEKGITLIALVVTLVVLIILAVISVNALLGDDGLITKANDAKKHQSNAIAMGKGDLDQLDTKSSNTIKEHLEGPANAIGKILEEGNYVWYTNNDGTQQKCIVLYGPENKNYSKYGVQIITEETLGEITIGNSKTNIPEGQSSADTNDFNVARQSYNDIVTNLQFIFILQTKIKKLTFDQI